MAVFMGVCYLINPLNQQLYRLLHSVSHSLSAPSFVMEHSATSLAHSDHVHYSSEHIDIQNSHEHALLDLVGAILHTSQTQDQPFDAAVPEIFMDKHLTSYSYSKNIEFYHKIRHIFYSPGQDISYGYSLLWLEPPIYFTI
jgi:hypothetical protein